MKHLRALLRNALTSSKASRFVSLAVFGTDRKKSTVQNYRDRAAAMGLTWAHLCEKTSAELRALFRRPGNRGRPEAAPDFRAIEEALSHPGMTLQTYWEEERAAHPETTLSYSRMAALFNRYAARRKRTMRIRLVAGEKVFVDYSGKRPWYFDASGNKVEVEMFVAALGRSGKIFAWCSRSQTVADWVDAHVRMFDFYGGVAPITVSDNLKSAVVRPGRDPTIQRTYLELGEHYGTAILPARAYRPKHKPKAEGSVLLMQRAFLPMLRHHRCGSLEELNALLAARVEQVNRKGFTRRADSRDIVFEREDAPALQPLPKARFEYVQWSAPKVVPHDYHVRVGNHWYSVPESWVGHTVEACFSHGEVVIHREDHAPVRHPLSTEEDGQTTALAHMPAAHRMELKRTPDDLKAWAAGVGPNTAEFVRLQFERKVPLQGFPKAEEARTLAAKFGEQAIEEAAGRAIALRVANPTGLRRLLSTPTSEVSSKGNDAAGVAASLSVQPPATSHRQRRSTRVPIGAPPVQAGPDVPLVPVLRSQGRRVSKGAR